MMVGQDNHDHFEQWEDEPVEFLLFLLSKFDVLLWCRGLHGPTTSWVMPSTAMFQIRSDTMQIWGRDSKIWSKKSSMVAKIICSGDMTPIIKGINCQGHKELNEQSPKCNTHRLLIDLKPSNYVRLTRYGFVTWRPLTKNAHSLFGTHIKEDLQPSPCPNHWQRP